MPHTLLAHPWGKPFIQAVVIILLPGDVSLCMLAVMAESVVHHLQRE
jgi:hypothetical protein